MPHGKKYGGRKKGTPNKSVETLQAQAERLGVDPFEILLLFAKGDHKSLGYEAERLDDAGNKIFTHVITPELRARCAEKACEYLKPKLKAVEISVNPEMVEKIREMASKTEEELLALVKQL